jgi:hypothetical protein
MNSGHKAWIFVVVIASLAWIACWSISAEQRVRIDAQAREYTLKHEQLVVRVLEVTDMIDRASGGQGGGSWKRK